jgi:hypothetical protein
MVTEIGQAENRRNLFGEQTSVQGVYVVPAAPWLSDLPTFELFHFQKKPAEDSDTTEHIKCGSQSDIILTPNDDFSNWRRNGRSAQPAQCLGYWFDDKGVGVRFPAWGRDLHCVPLPD